MLDFAIAPSGARCLTIRSSTLFADLNSAQTKAFLSCFLEADPNVEIAIQGATATVKHSHASPATFIRSVVQRLRTAAGQAASAVMPASVASPAANGRPAAAKPRTAVRSAVNGSHHGASNGTPVTASATPSKASSKPQPFLLDGAVLVPDRSGVTRVSRNGHHATSWQVVHELPGRLRLKHPSLYRRKEACQDIERELMSVLGINRQSDDQI